VKALFVDLGSPATLKRIRKEVNEGAKERDRKGKGVTQRVSTRGKSKYVMDAIHKLLNETKKHLDCKSAEGPCLLALVEELVPLTIGKLVIDTLAKLIPTLYRNLNTQKQWFTRFNQAILTRIADASKKEVQGSKQHKVLEALANHSKAKLRVDVESRILLKTNYTKKVALENAKQKEVNWKVILEAQAKWHAQALENNLYAKIGLVALSVGSRLVEVCLVSKYEPADSPKYITVVGVAKAGDEKHGGRPRTVTKPIIGYLASEQIISLVKELRLQLETKYNWNLGTGSRPNAPTPQRQTITNTVDAQANKTVREMFGETFVFHSLRGLYAAMAWATYRPSNMSQAAYYSKILGHREDSVATAASYTVVTVTTDLKQDDPTLVAKINNLQIELKVQKEIAQEQKEIDQKQKEIDQKQIEKASEMAGAALAAVRELKHPQSNVDVGAIPMELEAVQITPSVSVAAGVVNFLNKAKQVVLSIKKEKKKRDGDTEKLQRLISLVDQMRKAGTEPTHAKLRSLGFGSRIVGLYFKKFPNPKRSKKAVAGESSSS